MARYPTPYPYSLNELDYPVFKRWSRDFERVSLILQSETRVRRVWKDGNLFVHYVPHGPHWIRAPLFIARALPELTGISAETTIDVINASDLVGGIVAVLASRRLGSKFILQVQDDYVNPSHRLYATWQRWFLRRLVVSLCRRADLVRCLFGGMRDELVELGVTPQSIVVIPSRFDPELFDPSRFANDSHSTDGLPTVLFVGSLVKRKNVNDLIRAVALLLRRGHSLGLRIVGDGPERAGLQRLTRSLDIESSVEFVDKIPHSEIPAVMHRSFILVLPSLGEATPRVVMEAMAMKLPVVATRVGGLSTEVIQGVTGLLVDPSDVDQLAEAIESVIVDPEWAKGLGEAGRAHALENFTVSSQIKKMVDMHHSVLTLG